MSTQLSPTIVETDDGHVTIQLDDLVEQIWRDLDRQISPERIRQVAAEVAAEYLDATVTTFVPIFVYRQTVGKLTVGRGQNKR